jgi:hypothetical protein
VKIDLYMFALRLRVLTNAESLVREGARGWDLSPRQFAFDRERYSPCGLIFPSVATKI